MNNLAMDPIKTAHQEKIIKFSAHGENLTFQNMTHTTLTSNQTQSISYRKRVGVRRLVYKSKESNNKINHHVDYPRRIGCYPQGCNNPLVQSLIKNNPGLLHRILSTRDFRTMKILEEKDLPKVIQSNSLQNNLSYLELQDKVNHKQGLLSSPTTYRMENNMSDPFNSPAKSFQVKGSQINQNKVGVTLESVHLKDKIFVHDIMEESKTIQYRKHLYNNVIHYESESDNDSRSERTDSDSKEIDFCLNDLIWLTNIMEKEWNDFIEAQGSRAILYCDQDCFEDHSYGKCKNINTDSTHPNPTKKRKRGGRKPSLYGFKASIMLTKGSRCDLGTFQSSVQAAKEYDKFAIGRRTLGRKLLEEVEMRQRLQARKAAYTTIKRITQDENGRPKDAAILAYQAAASARMEVNQDEILLSTKVLTPELNFPGWDTSGSTFSSYVPSFIEASNTMPRSRRNMKSSSFPSFGSSSIDQENPVEIAHMNVQHLLALQKKMMDCESPEKSLLDIVKEVFSGNDGMNGKDLDQNDDTQNVPSTYLDPLGSEASKESSERIEDLICSLETKRNKLEKDVFNSMAETMRLMKLEKSLCPLWNDVKEMQTRCRDLYCHTSKKRKKSK